ncbi:MAG: polyprenyl synthetase family protein [Planctomycetia bacterium]
MNRSAVAAQPASAVPALACPSTRQLRDRLRALASDLVARWRADGLPAAARTPAGLRAVAKDLVARAGGGEDLVGWTMVTIVSEHWRERLAAGPGGRRLLLLPDCPGAAAARPESAVPEVCGPACGIATIWSAARDSGWVVEPTARAVAAIGALLTGQYEGILGVAKLEHLEKAFAMLPAFSLPVAAVPYQPAGDGAGSCAAADAIDIDWVLGLLGVAGGAAAPMGDYLPLLREAAEMFTPDGLAALGRRQGLAAALPAPRAGGRLAPLDATAALGSEFLARGGKFLRPFIALAAYDAVRADLAAAQPPVRPAPGYAVDEAVVRDSVKAAAVAIEVFHKASLVHDDIEDDDAMRYGQPTLHRERGVPTAINVGDHLLGLGYRIVAGLAGVDATTAGDVVRMLADAHVRLARGQGAELWWREDGDKRLQPDEALEIYGLKTSPAFEVAIAMGIRLAGPRPADAAAVDRFALHVGTGFQVLNDLKDWQGDLENARRAAGDLLGGRPTVLWALALERLSADDAAQLRGLARAAGAADATEATVAEAVAAARDLYRRADVFARAAAIVRDERARATAAIAGCRLPRLREVLEFLLDLAVPEAAADIGNA